MCKKMICLTTLVFVLSMALASIVSAADPSLVAWYRFDGDASDSSGNELHGKEIGNPTYEAGVFGQAISLDGNGDYVDCGLAPKFNITDFITFTYWIKVVEFDKSWNTVLSKGDNSWRSSRAGETHFMEAAVSYTTGDFTYGITPVDDDQWHHVGFVYDGKRNYLYVDGELDASEASTGQINVSRYPLWIGENSQFPGRCWNGLIEDVQIYNRALSQEEIQVVMQRSTVEYLQAWNPTPADGDMYAYTSVSLSWRAGDFAVSHDVYFGDNFDEVNDGTGSTFQGNQTETVFKVGLPGGPYPDGLIPDTTYYWRIDEVEADGNTIHKGDVWSFTCSAQASLPQGWMSQDIGTTGGSADESGGTWTISGDGADIWGSSDAFRFAYIPLSGDGMIVARVLDNGSGSDTWAKGGVMIRETLDANSKHAMMIITGGAGAGKAFQCRPNTGSYSFSSHGGSQVSPPMWIKLVREGNLFTGYYSVDGINWQQQPDGTGWDRTPNPIEINMTRDVYVGICVTSVVVGEVRTYRFDHVSTEPPKIALRPDPADGALYEDTSVSLSWRAGDLAVSHDVYFGDNFDEVNDGTWSTFQGNQTETVFKVGLPGGPYPDGLILDTTYYWRIDEVEADGTTIHKGDVWSFTVGAEAEFTFGTATNLGSTVNSGYWEASPSISADGLALFFDSDRFGGSGDRDLYVTTRATKDDDWGRPLNLGQPVNTSSYDGQPDISADGLSLYFSSDRPGGFGNQDLWVTTRPTTDDEWGTPINLEPTVNSLAHDTEPSISADGLTLFFDSDRPGGYGSWDIWMVTRASTDEPWGTPVPLPPPVNSVFNDGEPSISVDGRALYFCSDRPGGYGTFDLWLATRETTDDEWSTPVNLGTTVNTTYHDWGPSISVDGSTLYFTAESVRNLCQNNYDLWQVSLLR